MKGFKLLMMVAVMFATGSAFATRMGATNTTFYYQVSPGVFKVVDPHFTCDASTDFCTYTNQGTISNPDYEPTGRLGIYRKLP